MPVMSARTSSPSEGENGGSEPCCFHSPAHSAPQGHSNSRATSPTPWLMTSSYLLWKLKRP